MIEGCSNSAFSIKDLGADALSVIARRRSSSRKQLSTLIESLDKVLDGGFPAEGGIIELCGLPGTGKTQFCMQMAAVACSNASTIENPAAPYVIYIDTEGCFTLERFEEVQRGIQQRMEYTDRSTISADVHKKEYLGDCVVANLGRKNIMLLRLFDPQELLSVLDYIYGSYESKKASKSFRTAFLDSSKEEAQEDYDSESASSTNLLDLSQLKLMTIDSIGFMLRHSFAGQWTKRANFLSQVGVKLNKLSAKLRVPLVVTNQMMRTSKDQTNVNAASYGPALGDTWSRYLTYRLIFYSQFATNDKVNFDATIKLSRFMRISKPEYLDNTKILFEIQQEGIK